MVSTCSHLFQYIKLSNFLCHRKPEIIRFYVFGSATCCWSLYHINMTQNKFQIRNWAHIVCTDFYTQFYYHIKLQQTIADRINWGDATLESCSYENHIKKETSLITLKPLHFLCDINDYAAYAKHWMRHFVSMKYGI